MKHCLAVAGLSAAALILCAAGPAAAQETTGSIQGRVVDTNGQPLPGVTVTATGAQGQKTAVTDTDGHYSLPFLTPTTYSVKFELSGFKTVEQKNVVVAVGQTVTLPHTMEVGGVTEQVEVTGTAPVVDTTSTTTGATISSDFVLTVPVGRRIADVAYMAPGVSSSGTAGRMNPSMAGGSGLDNQYVIDGVNVTNTGYGALGSYSIIFGSLGNATPFDFVQDVQVKTGGYQAEFGQATGGVLNVTTKSGSNTLAGSAFGYGQLPAIQGNYQQFQSKNGTVQTISTTSGDGGVEAGGPIWRDRIFFFGAVDPQTERTTIHAPAGFPLESLGDVDRRRTSVPYSTKLTWQVSGHNRIDASFFGDPSHGANGPQRANALLNTDTTGFSSLVYGGHNQTVRYDGIVTNGWLVQATYARALNRISETPSVNTWNVTDTTVTPNVISGGIGFFEAGNRSVNNQWSATSTHIFGGHALKWGGEFDDVTYSLLDQRTGPTFLAPNGEQTATGAQITILPDVNFGRIFRVSRANFNAGRVTTQHYGAFFVQDEWHLGRLTINPGLRYEQETLVGTIVTDFTLKHNWAPRIGATYDPGGAGRSKIYGSFGRFYARVPNDLASRALSGDDSISRADYFDAGLTDPVPNGTVTQIPGGAAVTQHFLEAGVSADTIDPNAKMSYVSEFVAGYEHQIGNRFSVGVRYMHRDIGRVLEDVANCPMVAYELAATASACGSVEYILTNPSSATPLAPGTEFLGASFDNPVHTYDAVELTFNRQLANNWSMMASYRWSRLWGNFEGFYRDDNGQSDPGITSLYDFPTNDPSYTAIGGRPCATNPAPCGYLGDIRFLGQPGLLPLDRTHQGKLFVTRSFGSLNLGVAVNLSSGQPLTALAANPNYTNGGEIPTTPRGAGFQTVDGFRTRTPFQSQVDLQASYQFRPGRRTELTILADVYNILNERRVLNYDNFVEIQFQVPNPDFGAPVSQIVSGPQFQPPISARLGFRLTF